MRQLLLRLFSCFALSVVVSLCAVTDLSSASSGEATVDSGSFDSFGDDSPINFDDFDNIPDIDPSQMQLRVPSFTIAAVLEHIQQPLWKSTIAPVGRDTLYLLPQKITAIEYGGISVKFFFNMTNRMKMSVDDMLTLPDVSQDDIKQLIENLIPGGPGSGVFQQLIPLFQKITIQERKAGALLQGGFIKGSFILQATTALQLGERNFWLSKYDQSVMQELFGSATESDKKEFYKIAAGFADTRIKFGLNTLNMTSFQNDFGFSCILPTSRLTQSEKMNLGLVQPVFDNGGPEALKTEAVRSLKAVRDYLLNPRLGNNGHFAVGCYAEQKFSLFHDFMQLWVGASYDLFMPNEEERLYMFKPTLKPADMHAIQGPAGGAVLPPDVTAANDVKVTNYIRQYILPSSFKVTVLPGDVTNLVVALTVDWNKSWRSTWGYDFYAQRKPLIQSIHDTSVSLNDLRIDDEISAEGESLYAYQHKLFSETLYRKHTKHADFGFGLGIGSDMTISSKRIGEDWTVYFKCAATF